MKKLLFLILFISLSFLGHSQYNITQNLGGPTTLVQNPNYGGFRGGLIPYTFSDTTSANGLATSLKLYNGALIYCTADNAVYWRDATNQKWVQLLPSGGTGGLSAWLTTGNFAVPTDVNGYAKFGTFGTNGINVITSGNTVFKIHADGIVPDTGTVQGLGVNSYGELSYFSGGGGSTPTWQQTLTAGSTLNTDNTIDNGANTFTFTNNTLAGDFGFVVSSNSTASSASGQVLFATLLSGTNSNSGQTTTASIISNTHTGTSSTNVGLNIVAQGANSNYALIVQPGGGNVGIGTTTPTQLLSLGTSGSTSGIFNAAGSTSGTITFQPQAAAGTYNWNWPTTAGTSGYLLTSAGGGSSAMTWTDPASLGSGLAIGSTVTSATAGSIFFAGTGGILQQKNSDFFYDSTNKRLGIGTNSPSTTIHATASGAVAKFVSTGYVQNTVEISDPDGYTYITNGQFKVGSVPFVMNANGSYITYQTGGVDRMRVTYAGDVGIGNTSPGEKLEVTGNVKSSGKVIARNIIYRTLNASDADFTAAVGTAYVLPDAATTARTVTLPAGQDGDIIRFHLPLTPSNHWTFSTAVTLPDGSTYTNIDTYTNSVTTIQYDGANSVWRAVVNL